MNNAVCLSFDVEDWFQVENLREEFPFSSWNSQKLRVEKHTHVLLDLLDKYQFKATFFVLGWIAERLPELVSDIYSRGHEIASHGYSHQLNSTMSQEEIVQDIVKSKSILENIIHIDVIGYRAPCFSVNEAVMDVLHTNGFKYDSSLILFKQNSRYGKLESVDCKSPFIHKSGVIECPLPVLSFAKNTIPISGGGYFRLIPFPLFHILVERYLSQNGFYLFYFHPWEIDVHQPYIRTVQWGLRFRHYYGLCRAQKKLEQLFSSFPTAPKPISQFLREDLALM